MDNSLAIFILQFITESLSKKIQTLASMSVSHLTIISKTTEWFLQKLYIIQTSF